MRFTPGIGRTTAKYYREFNEKGEERRLLIQPELGICPGHNMIRGGREFQVWMLGGLRHQDCSQGKARVFDRSKVADETTNETRLRMDVQASKIR